MPAPKTRDYFAELYVAAMFGDQGWSVYFPKRDVGFDFIATRAVGSEVLIRPVQVKGLYPTRNKKNKPVYGFIGKLTALHSSMVLAIPFFHVDRSRAPDHVAFMPLDGCKRMTGGRIRSQPARFLNGYARPRREYLKYFDSAGLKRVEDSEWERGD